MRGSILGRSRAPTSVASVQGPRVLDAAVDDLVPAVATGPLGRGGDHGDVEDPDVPLHLDGAVLQLVHGAQPLRRICRAQGDHRAAAGPQEVHEPGVGVREGRAAMHEVEGAHEVRPGGEGPHVVGEELERACIEQVAVPPRDVLPRPLRELLDVLEGEDATALGRHEAGDQCGHQAAAGAQIQCSSPPDARVAGRFQRHRQEVQRVGVHVRGGDL
mmetsp:Transcript_9662/g.26493  ORF Transcript_9662/g.26493 Transcript_9662/m.26493 type:complete len:216 (-) Transcript_9662:70-717(-)